MMNLTADHPPMMNHNPPRLVSDNTIDSFYKSIDPKVCLNHYDNDKKFDPQSETVQMSVVYL